MFHVKHIKSRTTIPSWPGITATKPFHVKHLMHSLSERWWCGNVRREASRAQAA
ncbi:hypothetical protein HMPREF0578_0576 [Mobiluncus mulieris 28-1]|nr:hypothetical protein HMPREF0578_0576 [Mobiluncus mulieris 28-1]